MKQIITYELTDNDKMLLKTELPNRPYEYDHHDLGFCGSSACYAYEKEIKPYKEAGLLNYMLLKEKLLTTLNNNNLNLKQVIETIQDFKDKIPENIIKEMSLGFDINSYLEKFINIEKQLKKLYSNLYEEININKIYESNAYENER